MILERLFDRCPPIPVDETVTIPRHVHSIRNIVRQMKEAEDANDMETAAVLQIRILLLICKTLPCHPDYGLEESKPAVKELHSIAHAGFANIERLSDALSESQESVTEAVEPTSLEEPVAMPTMVQFSVTLLELFERIAAKNTAKNLNTVGFLATRVTGRTSSKPSATADRVENISRVAALIIPSQTCLSERSDIRYEADISQLLKVKGLIRLGFLEMCPNQSCNSLSPASARLLAQLQRERPEAVSVVIAPQDTSRICSYSLSEAGLSYVLSCAAQQKLVEEVIPNGRNGEGRAIWNVAKHVDITNDSEPQFKLYDLRPLAIARDEHERSMEGETAR